MFYDCTNLSELDLSGWDVSKCSDMAYMFGFCSSLTSLNISGWAPKLSKMEYMFQNCAAKEIDATGFDTSNVTTMYGVFKNCAAERLDVSNFKTGQVTSIQGMFQACKAKEIIFDDNPSSSDSCWNMNRCSDFMSAFQECETEILDLSGWYISAGTKTNMFKNCKATTGYAADSSSCNYLNYAKTTNIPSTLVFVVKPTE